jgi:cbb3-type cytochrome oxidase subunit 1
MGDNDGMTERIDRFVYDDAIVRLFLLTTVAWGLVGTLVGLVVPLQLVNPAFNLGTPWLSFGRLRPLHTNAVILRLRPQRHLHRRLLLVATK